MGTPDGYNLALKAIGGSVNLESNIRKYLDGGSASDGRKPNERYASFDYCFNYFQAFRESNTTTSLANSAHVQTSCLHLGFYLASWGMLRGSTALLQKSARHLVPIIDVIAQTEPSLWEVDAWCYTDSNIKRILALAGRLRDAQRGMSDTLLTKILLGVFGSVPAFDTNFKKGCKVEGVCATFGSRALNQISAFYQCNATLINSYRVQTLDFVSGTHTKRTYTCAKVIDMAFFTEGENPRN